MEALDKKDKLLADKVMAIYCFDIIISHLRHKTPPPCPDTIVNEKVLVSFVKIYSIYFLKIYIFRPLFITWKKASNHHLRGCIGTFSRDLPLRSGLVDYAKTRFASLLSLHM